MTTPTDDAPYSELILYQTEDGRSRIECRFEDETIWLTQALLAQLFDIGVGTVNHHPEGDLRRGRAVAGGNYSTPSNSSNRGPARRHARDRAIQPRGGVKADGEDMPSGDEGGVEHEKRPELGGQDNGPLGGNDEPSAAAGRHAARLASG